MRALTLTQPWAGFVASGVKLVENRPRSMIKREDFGKVFAIHASREVDDGAWRRIIEIAPEFAIDYPGPMARNGRLHRLARVTSAVIAVATLEGALYIGGNSPETTRAMLDRAFGFGHEQERWTFGPTCYVLGDVRALREPVKCRGWQGFWTLPTDLEASVRERIEGAF